MDTLHFCIAIVPVSVYLLIIGLINLSPRPFLTTGLRDLSAIAIAVAGFFIVGPMELFLPETVASLVGGWVWLPLIVLYALLVTFLLLLMRPRLVIYNLRPEQLRPMLQEVVHEIDPTARWAGSSVAMPDHGIQFAIDGHPGIRNVSIVSVGADQDLDGWARLKDGLQRKLSGVKQPANTQGVSFVMLSGLLLAVVVYYLMNGTAEIPAAIQEMLRS